ncbi:MAG: hypothetical protein WBG90_00380 [Saonia sp.]
MKTISLLKPCKHLSFYFYLFLLVLWSFQGFSQKSISKKDIEITTQLTFIRVQAADKNKFEQALSRLSLLARENKIKEDYDWLGYESDSKAYLFINFSTGLNDVLKLSDYREEFYRLGKKVEFDSILDSLKDCNFEVTGHFLQEMLLPWSSVKEISVSKHPFTTMVEYKIYADQLDEFDTYTRQLVKLLKETGYEYPLEGNRGSFGAYSSVFHIWFYDKEMRINIQDHLETWMKKKGKKDEWKNLFRKFDSLSFSRKNYQLKYLPKISY